LYYELSNYSVIIVCIFKKMVFFRHLLRQKYLESQITVITMYKGQERQIRQRMRSPEFAEVKITSVDNFQGTSASTATFLCKTKF